MDATEKLKYIESIIAQLPSLYRRVLSYKFYFKFSYRTISEDLELPTKALKALYEDAIAHVQNVSGIDVTPKEIETAVKDIDAKYLNPQTPDDDFYDDDRYDDFSRSDNDDAYYDDDFEYLRSDDDNYY